MTETIPFQNTQLRYRDLGTGLPVVLLHGYLESLEIWQPFQEKLAEKFRVIAPDLPGHGHSGPIAGVNTMDDVAQAVNFLLEKLHLGKVFMFGHSMGGYATLAFARHYSGKLHGFSLVHSHPFADTPQTIENRNREIQLVREGKQQLLFRTNIPKGFADKNLQRFSAEIKKAQQTALNTPPEGIIALLEGMKQRQDSSHLLKTTTLPFLYVIGRHDNYIPFSMLERIELPPQAETLVLENSGHSGFIEEQDKLLETVTNFMEKHQP